MTNNDDLSLKLKAAAEKAVPALEKLASITCDEIFDAVAFGVDGQVDIANEYSDIASPANILALLAERDDYKKRIAELEQKADIYDMLRTDYELEGSLVDFVDWQAKRIEMLEKYTNERDAENQDLMLTIGRFREEREARTVSVKLPENTPLYDAPEYIWLQTDGVWPVDGEFSELTWCCDRQNVDDTLYVRADLAAGINLEVGE
ncbi:hypothetical protein GA0061070_106115 [Kosakonia oryziphila]|uniref:Ead/Ea22-like family protein n=1 Tax=Kosakonia oryziphila TaxID=1005667 RepID=A0A1C4GBZ1_9ENTR|nr:hypothetical protein [Kosakonia oryziphila]SCC65656.1 hypothetical protein GA0061070_106115 [Kosakonia oryziphila]